MTTKFKWNEENKKVLTDKVGTDTTVEVTVEQVSELAETLEVSERSVSAKLRSLGFPVEKVNHVRTKTFTPEQEQKLIDFVQANPQAYTHAELAAVLFGDEMSARQIQGKLLSLDLLSLVKPTAHVEVERKFTDAEEEIFIKMVNSGAFIEDIAATLNKEINSVRGKALSLLRKEKIKSIPPKRDAKVEAVDPIDSLEDIEDMTVEDIAKATGKTERGVKTVLTKRGIKSANYDGEKKAARIAEKKAA